MIEVIQFPTPVSASFVAALKRAQEDPEVEGIILDFSSDNPDLDDELEVLLAGDNIIDPLRDTLRVLETQPKPLVSLIHRSLDGLAGEVALACHQRFVLEPDLTFHWRWSELGLLPALGTGHRLAHLVGLEKTVQALLFSSPLAPADFLAETNGKGQDAAEVWIKEHPKPVQPWDAIDITRSPLYSQTLQNREILQRAHLQLRKRTPADDGAGSLLLQSFHGSLERSFTAALRVEKVASQKARALVSTKNRIYVQQELRQQAIRRTTNQTETVETVGVLGAGLMGTGIALSALLAGRRVVLFEVDEEAAKRSSSRIQKVLNPRSQDQFSQLKLTQQLDDLSRCDFVVEAVFERFDVKTDLLKRVSSILPKHAIVASNTTTFPISELAAATPDPGRFIGTHFFAPVEQMELLEIILGRQTTEATLNKTLAFAKALGKTPVVVKDGPGFYTSRVVMVSVSTAMYMPVMSFLHIMIQ